MIRVIVFLLAVGAVALGVAWLADRPGAVTITWLGYRIDTSVMMLAAAVAFLTVVLIAIWGLLVAIVRSPKRIAARLRNRRAARGHRSVERGLIAIGSGDATAARKFAREAVRLAPGEPLTLLLTAQAAQLAGNRAEAERTFTAMAARPDTKVLGLRGLYVEALRREDRDAARLYAEEAARSSPALAWSGQAVLEFRSGAGDWAGALAALERGRKSGTIEPAAYRRERAVLLTAQAASRAESGDPEARAPALEAIRLAPDLVPAVVLAARLLAEAGELRKAQRLLEKRWREDPHPDLAEAYVNLRAGDSARERLARIRSLAEKTPGHPQAALAVARAAIDAREFALARSVLAPLAAQPTRRVATLMAEIEKGDGDEGRAREWMARALYAVRDPAWIADGFVSDRWLPVSPVSGRLDAFDWKAPPAEIAPPLESAFVASPEPAETRSLEARPLDAEGPEDGAERTAAPEPEASSQPKTASVPAAAATAAVAAMPALPAATTRAEPAEVIVPLVHAPDDPGPDGDPEPEPIPEKSDSGSWIKRPFAR